MLHLHSFLTHDRTEKRFIIIITSPCLGERRTNKYLNIQLPIKCFSCQLTASKKKKKEKKSRLTCNNMASHVLLPCYCQVLLPYTAGTDPPHCRSPQSTVFFCGRNCLSFLAVPHPLHAAFSGQNRLHISKQTTGDCTSTEIREPHSL